MSGADYFLDLLRFEAHLDGCDLVVTGEGRIDDQTLHGKLPAVVARRAAPVPVIAVVGRSDLGDDARQRMGLRAVHAIADRTDGNPANDPGCPRACSASSAGPCPFPAMTERSMTTGPDPPRPRAAEARSSARSVRRPRPRIGSPPSSPRAWTSRG